MKLPGSTKTKMTKDKNGGNLPYSEITETILVHCNIVNSDFQQGSRVLFVANKSIAQLLDISPKTFIWLKKLDLEFPFIEV